MSLGILLHVASPPCADACGGRCRERYINEQMGIKADDEAEAEPISTEEQQKRQLYAIPDHLKVHTHTHTLLFWVAAALCAAVIRGAALL